MECLLDDVGLSIGMVSLPFQDELDFVDYVISPIFQSYVDNVTRHFRDSSDPLRKEVAELYKPIPYYLFGRFDLALLFLVDDHDFSCRTLRPFHPGAPDPQHLLNKPHRKTDIPGKFDYKVFFGPTPRFTEPPKTHESVIQLLADAHTRPLFALTQIKVNNSLLLGGGAAFLWLIINFIKQKAKPFELAGTRVIILESYAWHEITLVMLGASYEQMLALMVQLRDASYGDLVNVVMERSRAHDAKTEAAMAAEFAKMRERHLVGRELDWNDEDLKWTPIFGNLTTNLGFNFEIFRKPDLVNAIDPNDHIHLLSRWFVKPGRMTDFQKLMIPEGHSLMSSVGRGDVWYAASALAPDGNRARAPGAPATQDAIRRYVAENSRSGLSSAALQRYTLTAATLVSPKVEDQSARRFSDRLHKLRFSKDQLQNIDIAMRKLRVPKVLIHRLLNVYANFNVGSLDRSLYASFAELRTFLVRVEKELLEQAKTGPTVSHKDLCRMIRKWADNFERAYRNRFHNSEHMGEVTDFNFEFKGGIQQVVTVFDAAYKALSTVLGAPGSFVSVGGDSGVESTEYEIRLNYFHVFQPEMFFAVAGKEASNWYAHHRKKFIDDYVFMQICRDLPFDEHLGRRDHVAQRVRRALRTPSVKPDIRGEAQHWLPASFLHTHFAELLTLEACYAGNWELFCHWSLGCFLQMSGVYLSTGRLDETEAARFLFRLRMAAGPMSKRQFADSITTFDDEDISELYLNLDQENQLEAVRDAIMKDRYLGRFFRDVRRVIAPIATLVLSGRDEHLVAAQQRARTEASRKHGKRIAEGKVPRYEPSGPFSAARFCQHVLYGYLELVKRQWGGKPPRLNRDDKGFPAVADGSAKLFVRSAGRRVLA